MSHTAAMISPSSIYDGLLRQAGVIELEDESELVPFVEALSLAPRAATRNVAILGEGGGFATLASDAVERAGLRVPPFSPEVTQALRERLGPLAGVGNPVDAVMVDQTDGSVWADLIRATLPDGIGAVLRFGLFQDESEPRAFESVAAEARALGQLAREARVPIVVFSPEGDADESRAALFRREGIPVVRSLGLAGRILAGVAPLATHPRASDAAESMPGAPSPAAAVLTEVEGLAVLRELGLPVPQYEVISRDHVATSFELDLGEGPLVLKAVMPGVSHKSDVGGVRTGLRGAAAVQKAAADMASSIEASTDHRVSAFIVMQQVPATGPELILSAHRDAAIGPLVTVGAGGVFAEISKDVVTFAAPVTPQEAEEMLRSLSIAPTFAGFRGSEPIDVAAIAAVVSQFSTGFVDAPQLAEVEVNPLMTTADSTWAVDAVVRREEQQ